MCMYLAVPLFLELIPLKNTKSLVSCSFNLACSMFHMAVVQNSAFDCRIWFLWSFARGGTTEHRRQQTKASTVFSATARIQYNFTDRSY